MLLIYDDKPYFFLQAYGNMFKDTHIQLHGSKQQ